MQFLCVDVVCRGPDNLFYLYAVSPHFNIDIFECVDGLFGFVFAPNFITFS